METKKSRGEVFNYLRNKGIGVNVHYIPLHIQPFFKKFGFRENDFQNAVEYYKNTISLPIYPKLSLESQKQVILSLEESLS